MIRLDRIGFYPSLIVRQHKGFTLVEVLVVIAIVSLLAGILFSAFSSVRNASRTSSCASNLKQIGLAIAMYAGDNRGRYPNNSSAVTVVSDGGVGGCAWADLILPYTRTTAVFICPATRNYPYVPGCPANATGSEPNDEDDYGINVTYDGGYDMNALSLGNFVSEGRFKHPTTTISVMDGTGSMITPAFQPPVEERSFTFKHPRHNGGNNALFLDGHVKWMSIESLKDPSWWPIGDPTP